MIIPITTKSTIRACTTSQKRGSFTLPEATRRCYSIRA